ncbi:MAG: glutamate 5-kinase [Lachnospiraceae bacterium]
MNFRETFADKKRIVVKIGSSSLTHKETGALNMSKLEVLVRELTDLHNMGKEVVLVSSGAIAVGRQALGFSERPAKTEEKQACASVGQARLMMIYQKLFSEYNQLCSQILMTKSTIVNNLNRHNAFNTFQELLKMGVIPIVNENDTVSTYEIHFGDNDTLSAIVASLVEADLLILLSDIDGLYTDDPNTNPEARFVDTVEHLDTHLLEMGKSTSSSSVGTGGMASKLNAAKLAGASGCDMVIANGKDFHVIHKIIAGEPCGTVFKANKKEDFYLMDEIERMF